MDPKKELDLNMHEKGEERSYLEIEKEFLLDILTFKQQSADFTPVLKFP